MIEPLELRADILACRVTGSIERDDITRLLGEIDRRAGHGAPLRVYAEVGDLSLMNLIGLSKHLDSLKERRHLLDQVDKAALVTDSALARQAVQFTARVPASLEVRLFSTAERAQARAWIEA
jgi:hypothetical protein